MRTLFIFFRLFSYFVVVVHVFSTAHHNVLDTALTFLICIWCVWDVWKRPDALPPVMRRGVWVEFLLIVAMGLLDGDVAIYFLLLSPIARACIHLPWWDSALIALLSEVSQVVFGRTLLYTNWRFLTIECLITLFASLYTFVMGELVRHRDKLRRVVSVAAFEREQHAKDDERVRMAGHLHDVMGQYWSGVVRALDVAMATTGEQQQVFLVRARNAAMEGLQEMRNTVHTWNEGRQTPQEWLEFVKVSTLRFQELTGVEVERHFCEVPWHQMEEPNQVAEAIARTVMESLTNAVRHGLATRVIIRLETTPIRLELSISDNGTGLQLRTTHGHSEGIGLRTMRRLSIAVGGNLRIGSSERGGAKISLLVPFAPDRAEATERNGVNV